MKDAEVSLLLLFCTFSSTLTDVLALLSSELFRIRYRDAGP